MPVHFHPSIDMGPSTLTTLLTRAGPTANPLSPATQGEILSILQQEQEHALSLLSLSPLLSSLFVSYASRPGAPATAFADRDEWKALQDAIAALREENEKLKLETREMVRKLEMAEASHEILRSQVSFLNETNTAHQEDVKSLRAENVEAKEKHNRTVSDLEAEKATLKVQISDLEAQRGQLRDTAVKQQIRITRLERPSIDTLALCVQNSPPTLRDSDSTPSPPLPDSPVSPFHPTMSPMSTPRVNGRLPSMPPSPSVVASLSSHPMARGGSVSRRHKAGALDLRSESSLNRCNLLAGLHTESQPIGRSSGELSPIDRQPTLQTGPETSTAGRAQWASAIRGLEGDSPDAKPTAVSGPGIPKVRHDFKMPEDIIDKILGSLVADFGCHPENSLPKILQSCSLVSKSWVTPCRQYLFHTVIVDPMRMEKWLQTFPVPEQSPANHVRHLYLLVRWYRAPPGEFFRRTQWFINAKKITVSVGDLSQSSLRIPPFARLPKSVTSLSIESKTVDLAQMRDVMLRLPALDDLSLSGSIAAESDGSSKGFGTVLRARFGGRLRLGPESIDEGIVNMLLEVPTGLHFTWVDVHVDRVCHSSVVRLTEVCRKTLARLRYRISVHDGQEGFDKPFDLSGFPNLQEVSLSMRWVDGDLQWVVSTLATLKQKTSPFLSGIHLEFNGPMHPGLRHPFSGKATLQKLSRNLQRIAAEFTRIEHDYEGAVDLVVFRASEFTRLDTHNALQIWDHHNQP